MTTDAIDAGLHRVERWRTERLDVPLWHERTDHMVALLARYLEERGEARRPLRLLELGCGAMAAEGALRRSGLAHVVYLPSDCYARDERTLVVDLDELSAVDALPAVDVILLGGVLEYLREPPAVLARLAARCRYLFFSYCPRASGQSAAERRGWKNHFDPSEIEGLASSLGEGCVVDESFSARAPKPVSTYFVTTSARAASAIACPGCRGSRSELAHVGELPLEDRSIRQETRVCRACALVFEVSEPDRDWTALYGAIWQRGALPSRANLELYASDARLVGPGEGRSVYEVGCGAGFLLDELAARGWRTAGCDPERSAVELARSKGHDVTAETFRARPGLAVDMPRSAVDLVVLGDVLEHQADPRAMLRDARAILASEGRAYVRVPDLAAIDLDSFGDVFGLQHRVWFTRETLRELLASEGFEVELDGGQGRGQFALARLAPPRDWQRPEGEPERSLDWIRAYSRGIRSRRASIDERLKPLAGREVALYGAGEHAQELLAFSSLGCIATRIADGNPELVGRCRAGLTVEPPQSLREAPPEVIVVASRASQDEIVAGLCDLELRGVEIVTLYPRRAA